MGDVLPPCNDGASADTRAAKSKSVGDWQVSPSWTCSGGPLLHPTLPSDGGSSGHRPHRCPDTPRPLICLWNLKQNTYVFLMVGLLLQHSVHVKRTYIHTLSTYAPIPSTHPYAHFKYLCTCNKQPIRRHEALFHPHQAHPCIHTPQQPN